MVSQATSDAALCGFAAAKLHDCSVIRHQQLEPLPDWPFLHLFVQFNYKEATKPEGSQSCRNAHFISLDR